MASGVLGVIVFFRRWRVSANRARICGIVYNSASFLITILCILLFGVVITSWIIQKNKIIFSQDTWGKIVQANPAFACSTEVRLGCAGYRVTECSFNFNDTSELYCPGHFCVDFCQIEEENVKQQALCSGCKNSKNRLGFSFSDCKLFERKTSFFKGCEELLTTDLRTFYDKVIVVGILSFTWIMMTTIAMVYLIFCT